MPYCSHRRRSPGRGSPGCRPSRVIPSRISWRSWSYIGAVESRSMPSTTMPGVAEEGTVLMRASVRDTGVQDHVGVRGELARAHEGAGGAGAGLELDMRHELDLDTGKTLSQR